MTWRAILFFHFPLFVYSRIVQQLQSRMANKWCCAIEIITRISIYWMNAMELFTCFHFKMCNNFNFQTKIRCIQMKIHWKSHFHNHNIHLFSMIVNAALAVRTVWQLSVWRLVRIPSPCAETIVQNCKTSRWFAANLNWVKCHKWTQTTANAFWFDLWLETFAEITWTLATNCCVSLLLFFSFVVFTNVCVDDN